MDGSTTATETGERSEDPDKRRSRVQSTAARMVGREREPDEHWRQRESQHDGDEDIPRSRLNPGDDQAIDGDRHDHEVDNPSEQGAEHTQADGAARQERGGHQERPWTECRPRLEGASLVESQRHAAEHRHRENECGGDDAAISIAVRQTCQQR